MVYKQCIAASKVTMNGMLQWQKRPCMAEILLESPGLVNDVEAWLCGSSRHLGFKKCRCQR